MSKKIILVLILTTLLFFLCGCSNNTNKETQLEYIYVPIFNGKTMTMMLIPKEG